MGGRGGRRAGSAICRFGFSCPFVLFLSLFLDLPDRWAQNWEGFMVSKADDDNGHFPLIMTLRNSNNSSEPPAPSVRPPAVQIFPISDVRLPPRHIQLHVNP
ncbi:hypothetical protein IWZ00DRAFT_511801 [Phyllosticta capitalensis]